MVMELNTLNMKSTRQQRLVKLPERITDEKLIELGFIRKANMFFGFGLNVMKLQMTTGAWRGCKGMKVEKDLHDMLDLKNFIKYYGQS